MQQLAERRYAGWGEPHTFSRTPLLLGPRDEDELEIPSTALRASHACALGWAIASTADVPTSHSGEEAS